MKTDWSPSDLEQMRRLVQTGEDMIGLARRLAEAKARSPRATKKLFAACGLTAAKGYALTAIGRQLPRLGPDRERLNRIGWAKLRAILPRLGTAPIEALLAMAEQVSAQDLPGVLSGRALPSGARRVVFVLGPEEEQRLVAALVACGAHQTRRGLRRKEAALMRLVQAAQPGQSIHQT